MVVSSSCCLGWISWLCVAEQVALVKLLRATIQLNANHILFLKLWLDGLELWLHLWLHLLNLLLRLCYVVYPCCYRYLLPNLLHEATVLIDQYCLRNIHVWLQLGQVP